MNITVREYQQDDFADVAAGMEALQDHIVSVDSCGFNIKNEGYGKAYVLKSLKRISEHDGKIFCAFADGIFLGCILGIIEQAVSLDTRVPLQEFVIGKHAEIIELIVLPESRGLGIGAKLMNVMEQYFKSKGCEYVFLDVFAPNRIAREFYEKGGYEERMITMIKPLAHD